MKCNRLLSASLFLLFTIYPTYVFSSFFTDSKLKISLPKLEKANNEGKIVLSADGKQIVYPNADLKTYSRVEEIDLNLRYSLVESLPSLGFQSDVKGKFIRQFKSQREALFSLPYHVVNVPYNAQSALKNLKPGDYYSVNARMALVVSSSQLLSQNLFPVVAGANYAIAGDFLLEIYRRESNKVLLRISSLKDSRFSVYAQANQKSYNFVIDKLLPSQVFHFHFTKEQGRLFSAEYEYDLNNSKARKAFESIVNLEGNFALLNPLRDRSNHKVIKIVQAKVADSESLSFSSEKTGVRKEFQSFTDFEKLSTGVKLNLFLFNFNSSQNFVEQNFNVLAKHRKEFERYKIATIDLVSERGF